MLKINSCRQRNTSLKLRDGSDIVSAINDSHFISKVMSWLLAVTILKLQLLLQLLFFFVFFSYSYS